MDRRAFIGTLAGGFLAAPLAGEAQEAARPPRIGVLAATPLTEALQGAIRDGLREHGYIEGRNIVIVWRTAEGRSDRTAALATELAHLDVDVIVALLTSAVQAAKNATGTIPIVMAPAGDPVGSGFVVSLARPDAISPASPGSPLTFPVSNSRCFGNSSRGSPASLC